MARLRRLGAALDRPAGLTPERRAALAQSVGACGGQQPDEPRAAAMARGLGLSGPGELQRLLREWASRG